MLIIAAHIATRRRFFGLKTQLKDELNFNRLLDAAAAFHLRNLVTVSDNINVSAERGRLIEYRLY